MPARMNILRAKVQPHHLSGLAALRAAETTALSKKPGERDTEFVRRVVCAYMNAQFEIDSEGGDRNA